VCRRTLLRIFLAPHLHSRSGMASDAGSNSRRAGWAAVFAAAGLVLSCGSERKEPDCLGLRPQQVEGIYGCITSANDVGAPSVAPLPGFPVQAFTSQPPPTPDDGLAPFRETRSDAAGFYALPLPAGSYWLCTTFRRCTAVTVPPQVNVPLHYEFGVGPGWSAP